MIDPSVAERVDVLTAKFFYVGYAVYVMAIMACVGLVRALMYVLQ